MRKILVTGSSGLIGSEVCTWFDRAGDHVHGVDNNQRADFFGPDGDTRWNQQRLMELLSGFTHHELDIRDRAGVLKLVRRLKPDAIVHAAGQPSHDLAAARPFDDFDTNAGGTLNLLEAARQACPDSPFVFMSTNKVYGDRPNLLAVDESATRYTFSDPAFEHGIPETLAVDACMHSPFGVSKLAADVMTQEYGRYHGMPTCCLRGGCLTGPSHSGVELHGFLSHLARSVVEGRTYTVFGYQGKQVRDNLHATDVAAFVAAFIEQPRSGEAYNLGGGKANTCSILEAFAMVESMTGQRPLFHVEDAPRKGDHRCYYSDLRKAMSHFPQWRPRISLAETIEQICEAWSKRRVVSPVK